MKVLAKNKIIKTPSGVYVQRYKAFLRLVKISKMLKQAKIVVHAKED